MTRILCQRCEGAGSWPKGTRQLCPSCRGRGSSGQEALSTMLSLAREVKGITLRELETRTGISNALLSQIETGKVREPSWRNVVKIAKALGLKLDRLAECE